MQKYPIGLQNFREIREGNFLYVDKTEIIHRLIDSGKYYFLSRPRRFGKSLLLSTIKEIFSGSKELFEGLWIGNNWNWEKKHPVIQLSFNQINYQERGLYNALNDELAAIARILNIDIESAELKDRFRELIRKAGEQEGVIILIDEYDKPIIDNLEDIPLAEENRSIMKNLYSVLKDADPYIRFLIITGVSKFSKVSIFSDLNNLEDITLSEDMHNLLGLTQIEIEQVFDRDINILAEKYDKTIVQILADIKQWYNGYSWDGMQTLYNPFSMLNLFKSKQFRNFWFETGTPTFLVNYLKKHKVYDFEKLEVTAHTLGNFFIENIPPITLLFQTGYLTVKKYDLATRLYELGYPNLEVKSSLLDYLLSAYNYTFPSESGSLAARMYTAFQADNI